MADEVHVELERIRDQVRLYGGLKTKEAAARSPEIVTLQRVFEEEFAQAGFEWAEVLAFLHDAISPIRVQPVNQRTGAASLDYSVAKEAPGVRVIAVGGNSLSRGLTLEGLCVSYFLRNSRAYDTLLQMSRWFGYRDGYDSLCRLFVTAEAEGWYRHVTDATNELKRDFARMRRQRATPAEFGLRVRTHPDTLLITARNKMANGINVVGEVRDISLAGRGIETARLYADQRRNEENLRIVDRFLSDLMDGRGAPGPSLNGKAQIWRHVPGDTIAKLLREFLVHPLNHDFQGDAISDFLVAAAQRGEPQLSHWTVALPTNGAEGPITPPLGSGLAVEAKRRPVLLRQSLPESLLVSGKKARVLHGLSFEQAEAVKVEEKKANPDKSVPEDAFRAVMQGPLLVIYLLRGFERQAGGDETPYRRGLVLPALGLHFPGIKDPHAPKRYVSYRLNRVAQGELELDGDDLSEEDNEVEDLWTSLRREAVEAQRRVHAAHPLDLYADFELPDRPGLILFCDERPNDAPPLKAIGIDRRRRQDGRWSMRIYLEEPRLLPVFAELCRDIIEFTRHPAQRAQPSGLVLSRIERWRSLMQKQPAGLSRAQLRGLIGELLVLERELLPVLGPDQAVSAWTGPLGTSQDFRLPDGRKLEVKALDRQADRVQINGLDQLDGGSDPLQLVVVRLEDTGFEAEGAITAARLIAQLRAQLSQAPAAQQTFDMLLRFAGWDDAVDADSVAVRLERIDRYDVDEGFPRLTAATVPAAVTEATYKIVLPPPAAIT